MCSVIAATESKCEGYLIAFMSSCAVVITLLLAYNPGKGPLLVKNGVEPAIHVEPIDGTKKQY